jgi:hypothetical protein
VFAQISAKTAPVNNNSEYVDMTFQTLYIPRPIVLFL